MKTNRTLICLSLFFALMLQALPGAAQPATGGMANAPALPRGISAWSYKFHDSVVKQINDFDAGSHLKFKYFFPYAGSPQFDPATRVATLYYNPATNSDRYAAALPPGTLIFPIVDCSAKKHQFDGWTDAEYKAAAAKVAQAIANDPHAAGVQIDIEPFAEGQLPFYRYLHQDLNAVGKYSTMFVGTKSEKLMTEIFESCDIVVISGYDIDGENSGVAKYKRLLAKDIALDDKVAKATHRKYMVGIPASASWGEYEYTVEKGGLNRVDTGNKQEDYVKAALDVLANYKQSPEYLGPALWQLSRVADVDEPEKATHLTKFPNYIRPSVWKILADGLPE